MINGIRETTAIGTGILHKDLKDISEIKEIPLWDEEERLKKEFELERQRIQPTYDSHGKIIEHEDSGRHLYFIA